MPSDLLLKSMNAIHRAVLTVTGGRVGSSVSGMPVLQLTTTGRKSGQPRTVILTVPAQIGDTLVVVASRGGDDRHPGWFLNLQDEPRVQVSVRGAASRPMRARVATAQEREDLWPGIVADHSNYGDYQTRTSRVIPLVLLEPQD
jgi:deazaflavin-dependent oxidoreductase (nitroreductase family)